MKINLNMALAFFAMGTSLIIVITFATVIRADEDGLGTASGRNVHATQRDQPSPVWTIRSTASRRAMAVRLTDAGNRLLRSGQFEKAVSSFEKALGIEVNPYIYFYLAQAHYRLGHYQDALNFFEVAESWLMQQPTWASELAAVKSQIPGTGVPLQTIDRGISGEARQHR